MTVRKYRSADDLNQERWYEPGSPELIRALTEIGRLAAFTLTLRFPRGVHRRRSIDELNAATEAWQEQNFRAHQERIRRAKP